MATQAELVGIGSAQVVARRTSVRIVAIHAAHLAFAQRVMVRHTELRLLGLVALETGLIGHRARLNHGIGLRRDRCRIERSARGGVEPGTGIALGLRTAGVNLVAIDAANLIGRVNPVGPVLGALVLGMAAQTNTVGGRSRALPGRNDFGGVTAAIDMKTAIAMALFALDALLRVIRVLEVFSDIRMASGAGVGSDRLGPRNSQVLCKRSNLLRGLLRC
jgi:hypothetical protein